jgi:hypothetical protein
LEQRKMVLGLPAGAGTLGKKKERNENGEE